MECPFWEKLNDSAYARWQGEENKAKSYEDVLDECLPEERFAMLLGNLNSQVLNGGFCQWVDNGYAAQADTVLRVLARIDTDSTKAVSEMIKRIKLHFKTDVENKGCMNSYWIHEWEGEEMPEGHAVAEDCDEEYYSLNDQFEEDIEKWLTVTYAGDRIKHPSHS